MSHKYNTNIFEVSTPVVGDTGKQIVGDALEATNFGPHSMEDFQITLNGICQSYFPVQLQTALQGFIKVHYNAYTANVLKDRTAIGDALQKAATEAEVTEIQRMDLFKK